MDDTTRAIWRHVFLLLFLSMAITDGHWVECFPSMKHRNTNTERLRGLEHVPRVSINIGVSSEQLKFSFLGELSL